MPHKAIELLHYVAGATCDTHGRDSPQCDAAKEIATAGSFAVAGAAIGGTAGGTKGAVIGGLVGLIAGSAVNRAQSRPPTLRATP